jgi:hypothetical protein
MRDTYLRCNLGHTYSFEELDIHNASALCEDVLRCPHCYGTTFQVVLLEDDAKDEKTVA